MVLKSFYTLRLYTTTGPYSKTIPCQKYRIKKVSDLKHYKFITV